MADTYKLSYSFRSGEPYNWMQVSGNKLKDKNLFTYNKAEVEAVIHILLDMRKKNGPPDSWFVSAYHIRAITFYKA